MPPSRFVWMDLMSASPVLLMDRWSRFSKSGVAGDPTLATREKGETVFEAVVAALVEFVREFKTYDRAPSQDLH
jgi:creatinine amidohydrolase